MSTETAEKWLPVPGYEGLYEVSDPGQVRSLPRRGAQARILTQHPDSRGNPKVRLTRDGHTKAVLVRSLVAAAFVGPLGAGVRRRPLNGDAGDASLANLELTAQAWASRPATLPEVDQDTALAPEILDRHLRYLRQIGHSEGSVYQRMRHLRRFGARLGVPVLDATAADLAAWRDGLAITPNAVVHYVSHLKSFFSWALDQGLVESNPAARLPVPRLTKGLPRPISEQDLMAALDTAPPRIRLWLILAAWCGLRAKEIAGLRRESILLTASPPVLIVTTASTKGGTTEHVVPLCEFAAGEIAAARLPLSGFVFRRHDGRPGPNAPHMISQLANSHLHDCGIAASLHQLRHFFGTSTYRASHDLLAVGSMMGHGDPRTTAGYAAFDQQSAVDAVAALPVPRQSRAARKAS